MAQFDKHRRVYMADSLRSAARAMPDKERREFNSFLDSLVGPDREMQGLVDRKTRQRRLL